MYSTKTVSSQTTSPWIPLDDNQAAFSATVAVTVSGTLTYSVEFTLDNVQDPAVTPIAFPIGLVGETTSNTTFIKSPVKAVRLNVTAFTSGSATIGARQGTDNVWGYPDSTDFAEAFSTTPKQVAVSGIPFVIPAGDGAAVGLFFTNSAGAFTLTAAINSGVWNILKGCWLYMQNDFVSSGYPAGWYWAVFSSDTAGILYTNTYSSRVPLRPASPTAFPSNLSGWYTTTTAEITGPTGFVLPGGSMGPNGKLKTHLRACGNTTANKSYRIYLDSSLIGYLGPTTTSPNAEVLMSCANQGVESLQANSRQAIPTGVGGAGGGYTLNVENSAVDTTTDKTFSISLQISTTSACAILTGFDTTCTYGA